ncbi:unnamed protein product [Closterium sp. NIES-53]
MTLAALGFAPSTADPSLFLRTDPSLPPFYILVYVDNLVFATTDIEALALVKAQLQKRHTYLGELRSYLGLQITRDRARRTITLTQSHMVQQVLQCFVFRFSLPQLTPLPIGHSLSAPTSDESVEPSGPYQELVGCLICEAEIYAGAMAAQEELEQRGQLRLAYVASRANTADVFTKALGSACELLFALLVISSLRSPIPVARSRRPVSPSPIASMEHRARSALRRFAALTLAAGLVALASLVAPTTAGDAYFPPYFGAPSGTGIYFFRPGEAEDESSFKVLIYDDPSSFGTGQALCAPVPQGGNRFAKGGVVRVRWDTSIGFLDLTCKRLTFHKTPRCGGRPYLALVRPDKPGGQMSDDEMRAMLTRR